MVRTFGWFLVVLAPVLLLVGPVLVALELNMGFVGILGAACIGGGASALSARPERKSTRDDCHES
jgi:hypothetical protein